MATFVALLRGVNVSGKNKLPMADLRSAAESAGFENVRTYVQSGNLIVDSTGTAKSIAERVRGLIESGFGLDVPVIVRTARQWAKIAETNPYAADGVEPKQLYVAFVDRKTKAADGKTLDTIKLGDDTYSLSGTEVFLNLVSGAGRTKLTNNAIENKLNTVATTRNWRTVHKILEML